VVAPLAAGESPGHVVDGHLGVVEALLEAVQLGESGDDEVGNRDIYAEK
jgi:hypothetical protein